MRAPAFFVPLTVALVGSLGCGNGCAENAAGPNSDLAGHEAAGVDILPVTFEELYPTFLWRKSMSQGDKASVWNQYRGHWVRWEGVIASITNKGLTLKQLRSTVTFDVSLTCELSIVAGLKQRFSVGDRVLYIGMLESYDDIFRTMYLGHGAVVAKVPHGDLGVVADMAHPVAASPAP